jgi:hypothetical protein
MFIVPLVLNKAPSLTQTPLLLPTKATIIGVVEIEILEAPIVS